MKEFVWRLRAIFVCSHALVPPTIERAITGGETHYAPHRWSEHLWWNVRLVGRLCIPWRPVSEKTREFINGI